MKVNQVINTIDQHKFTKEQLIEIVEHALKAVIEGKYN